MLWCCSLLDCDKSNTITAFANLFRTNRDQNTPLEVARRRRRRGSSNVTEIGHTNPCIDDITSTEEDDTRCTHTDSTTLSNGNTPSPEYYRSEPPDFSVKTTTRQLLSPDPAPTTSIKCRQHQRVELYPTSIKSRQHQRVELDPTSTKIRQHQRVELDRTSTKIRQHQTEELDSYNYQPNVPTGASSSTRVSAPGIVSPTVQSIVSLSDRRTWGTWWRSRAAPVCETLYQPSEKLPQPALRGRGNIRKSKESSTRLEEQLALQNIFNFHN